MPLTFDLFYTYETLAALSLIINAALAVCLIFIFRTRQGRKKNDFAHIIMGDHGSFDAGIAVLDPSENGLTVIIANPAAQNLLNIQTDSGKNDDVFINVEIENAPLLEAIQNYIQGQRAEEQVPAAPLITISPESPDKRTIKPHFMMCPPAILSNTITSRKKQTEDPSILCFLSDITHEIETQKAQDKEEKTNAIARLLSALAHDFNNILSIVGGSARMAQKKTALLTFESDEGKTDLLTHLDRIIVSADRGAELTKTMRIFAGNHNSHKSVFDCAKTLTDYLPHLQTIIPNTIKVDVESTQNTALYIKADPDHFKTILHHLVLNASQASKNKNDTIRIKLKNLSDKPLYPDEQGSTHSPCSYIQLQISDNGTGMDEKTSERIFDPYFTANRPPEFKGVGLSLVQGLVKNMQGQINVATTPDKGTTISITFPQTDEAPASCDDASSIALETDSFKGYTALVTDDEADILDILGASLREKDMTILQANSGDEALLVQEDHNGRIDFLITDIHMPDMDGPHLAELFLSLRPETHIIFMSGGTGQMNSFQNLPHQYSIIPKPFDDETLIAAITTHLKSKNTPSIKNI